MRRFQVVMELQMFTKTLIWIQYTKEASLIYDCHENMIYLFKGYMEIINHKYLLMRETEKK